jgi:hypothetical protein
VYITIRYAQYILKVPDNNPFLSKYDKNYP